MYLFWGYFGGTNSSCVERQVDEKRVEFSGAERVSLQDVWRHQVNQLYAKMLRINNYRVIKLTTFVRWDLNSKSELWRHRISYILIEHK